MEFNSIQATVKGKLCKSNFSTAIGHIAKSQHGSYISMRKWEISLLEDIAPKNTHLKPVVSFQQNLESMHRGDALSFLVYAH